jgi:thiol-disulfide isomerase/thioredoxin
MLKPLLLSLIILSSLSISAQEIKLDKDRRFAIELQTSSKGLRESELHYTYSFKALDKNSSGNLKLECTLLRFKSRESIGRGQFASLNTDSLRSTKLVSTGLLPPLSILQKPFIIEMNVLGVIQNISGVEEQARQSANKWQLKRQFTDQLLQNVKTTVRSQLQQLFLALPEENIKYKSAWTSADKQVQYEVTGIKGSLLIIKESSVKGDLVKNDREGLIQYNTSLGLIETSQMSTKQQVENKGIIESYTQMKLLYNNRSVATADTAWIDMAVRLSWMSDALKKNDTEYDDLKIFEAFKKYDKQFADDIAYSISKLNLIQRMTDKKHYKLYSEQLKRTPNHYLKGQYSHLHNKLGEMLRTSADSTYAVIKYLYKDKMFDAWVQHSFSQAFLSRKNNPQEARAFLTKKGLKPEEIEEQIKQGQKTLDNNHALLEMLINDKDPQMQAKIRPLYLWVDATKNAQNEDYLSKAAKQFDNMSVQDYSAGNGGRYSLLVYTLLKRANSKDAEAVLDKTITRLDKLIADTLNAQRYEHQNLNAHAYFLKYKHIAERDSVKALKYLSKAAGLAPKSKKEQAHSSYYDRAFLKSKESYRNEFLEKLFHNGDNEQALMVFVDHINANPEELIELQKTYEHYVPGKDFKTFVAAAVIPSWPMAPDFTLKGIDGKSYALTDFKGKWLLLDFWGTWCGPCRQEMPSVVAFNKEITEGKLPGISFLSIACHDTESAVDSYLKQNQYVMPALMSDNKIEKSYLISGYPSKVIISPEGKMLQVNYGRDWKKIMKQFSALHP